MRFGLFKTKGKDPAFYSKLSENSDNEEVQKNSPRFSDRFSPSKKSVSKKIAQNSETIKTPLIYEKTEPLLKEQKKRNQENKKAQSDIYSKVLSYLSNPRLFKDSVLFEKDWGHHELKVFKKLEGRTDKDSLSELRAYEKQVNDKKVDITKTPFVAQYHNDLKLMVSITHFDHKMRRALKKLRLPIQKRVECRKNMLKKIKNITSPKDMQEIFDTFKKEYSTQIEKRKESKRMSDVLLGTGGIEKTLDKIQAIITEAEQELSIEK